MTSEEEKWLAQYGELVRLRDDQVRQVCSKMRELAAEKDELHQRELAISAWMRAASKPASQASPSGTALTREAAVGVTPP